MPVADLRRRIDALQPALGEALTRVLRSGRFLLGPETEAFEAEFADFVGGGGHVVAVASGTDALRLSLVALGIGPGDEVVVPAFTAVPTAAAVCAVGAVPVPVDVDPDTAALDPVAATAAVTDRTRAVVPVHLYGRPAPLPRLGLPVVEDAAQAHGALDPNAPRGIAAAYSFYPTKNLGGIGDGGAVVTHDTDLAARLRRLRAHGQHEHGGYEHVDVAGNSRMSELEAAALRVGLLRLADGNARRRMIAARYRESAPRLRWQANDERHVYHQCVARIGDRESFRARVPFETAVHYPRALTQQAAYRGFVRGGCPEAEAWATECVSLPCFPELTDDEIEIVCEALR
ncbi:MAG: DegT/DnrJ/EryC1/StrS family aminotransferase [Acidimicrobiia bacterium]